MGRIYFGSRFPLRRAADCIRWYRREMDESEVIWHLLTSHQALQRAGVYVTIALARMCSNAATK